MSNPEALEGLERALTDVLDWLRRNGAAEIADNLGAPASEAELSAVEARFAPFPAPLRALYLRHDGQRDRDRYPFFTTFAFTDLEYGRLLHEGMTWSYLGKRPGQKGQDIDRSLMFPDPEAPLRDAELSWRWWPVGEDNGQMVAVNLDTGRVFRLVKDVPAIRLVAPDLTAWLVAFSADVTSGAYVVAGDPELPGVTAEGFVSKGKHLALRD